MARHGERRVVDRETFGCLGRIFAEAHPNIAAFMEPMALRKHNNLLLLHVTVQEQIYANNRPKLIECTQI